MTSTIVHPGLRIKAEVIPAGMSVTKAAQLMGIGRPALSNLLNGNAALSADMAARLEKAFNKLSRQQLMAMQTAYEAAQGKGKSVSETKTYVPPLLGVKANQIEEWAARNISARSRLSVFLRTLVHSTGRSLSKVDFPGNDNAERAGWDGIVEADEGTPWIPAGRSGWEFGTNENVKKKATDDFDKSVKALAKKDRDKTTFVFVTPRDWPGKEAWQAAAKAKRQWKDVRVYDASDLEQWLEQSIPGQVWFANETHISAKNVRSLDKCWADWANVCTPPLTGSLFNSAIEAAKRALAQRLSTPPDGPIVIGADSNEEALAFLAQIFGDRGDDLCFHRDRVLVFDAPGTLPGLAEGAQTFIPVATSREVERELGQYLKQMHSIVIYPRNAANSEPKILLGQIPHAAFSSALAEMGKDRDEINRLEAESGRSLTVLRRRLASGALRTPVWADTKPTASSLVPFLFAGAWHSANEADRLALSLLAEETPYPNLEREIQQLALLNDPPVWSIGAYRGVVSKIDLLYAIADVVTAEDLRRYFSIAEMVLGEDDPTLDLDDEKRWAAGLYGKRREFSSAFREGISETLVLLSIEGPNLFRTRLGVDTEIEATLLVRRLLEPMKLKQAEKIPRKASGAGCDESIHAKNRTPQARSEVTPMGKETSQSGPTQAVIKRLFAHSGNCCAFPRCKIPIVHEATIIGQICHIKAARPGGARFDPNQSTQARHEFDNLILLCANHHTIVDDDPEAYTVARLVKMKAEHESKSAVLSDEQASNSAELLIKQAVQSINQSGGITAHTVNVYSSGPRARYGEERAQEAARRILAPELNRTIARVLYIHSRAIPNFVCASVGHDIEPNDRKEDFLPHWPTLFPNAPQCSALSSEDIVSLSSFYDSLHTLSDLVNEWWGREDQLPVNILNSIMQQAQKSLKLALVCIKNFDLDTKLPPANAAFGSLSSRIERSLNSASDAMEHHIARATVKNTKANPLQRIRRV